MAKPIVRCAVYTRKSSEEGLDQEYNSLDAQRDACEAYIQSQRGEGWKLVPSRYDDGGFSGGNLERPGFRDLMEDIESGRVDVIVVYKVDRLTRSLSDFARIVDVFDRKGVSFVSVTQQFNTTTSMGRLTLNMLLSFAQFEREITGERIRDKIAASKKKGMWMGGNPALGYDVVDRKLVVNKEEAKSVNHIYRSYLEVGCVSKLARRLESQGVHSKRWTSQQGITRGGGILGRGALYRMLQNRTYLGQIEHHGEVYEGEHDAIVDEATWEAVQQQLDTNRNQRRPLNVERAAWVLEGLVVNGNGTKMTPHYTQRRGSRVYRYYIDQRLIRNPGVREPGMRRVPAQLLEETVLATIQETTRSTQGYDNPSDWRSWLERAVESVEVGAEQLRIRLRADELTEDDLHSLGKHEQARVEGRIVHLTAPFQIQRRGGETIVIQPEGTQRKPRIDPTLVKALVRAWRWRNMLEKGQAASIDEVAKREGFADRYIRKHLPLAFLAPDIVEAILDGRQPATLNLTTLTDAPLPHAWEAQRKTLGILRSPAA